MEGDPGKRIHGDPPIAVVLLDRLVDDGGRIIGNACLREERVERAEIGRDEIVGALYGHRHKRRRAGLRGRQKLGDQGFQRIRALRRGGLVGGKGGGRPQRRRSQGHGRKATTPSARAESDGGYWAARAGSPASISCTSTLL